jgi:hypothetical protein
VNSIYTADVVIADFEEDGYAGWQAVGKAFGSNPATGALPNQQLVSGFEGHGLAKRPNKLDAYPKAMAFLARHLAG